MSQNIVMARDSLCEDVLDVQDAVDASIDRSATTESVRVQTILHASYAVPESFLGVSEGARMADGSKDGPATLSLFESAESACLVAVPHVDVAALLAGDAPTAATGAEFVYDVHSQ